MKVLRIDVHAPIIEQIVRFSLELRRLPAVKSGDLEENQDGKTKENPSDEEGFPISQ